MFSKRTLSYVVIALVVGAGLGFALARVVLPARGPLHGAGHNSGKDAKYYVCEVHGHISEEPGICPICGTELKPAPAMPQAEGGAAGTDRKISFWRSPMDPTFVSKGPGKDGMGMDLVPVYEGDPQTQTGTIVIRPEVTLQMGIRTEELRVQPLVKRVRTVGSVTYNEETLGTVTTKLDGWIERLLVDKTGQVVQKGDALFDFYSKDLEAAQTSFLDSLKDPRLKLESVSAEERARAEGLLESARNRLASWDITAEEINAIAKEGKVRRTITLHSPFSGVVTKKVAQLGRFFKAGAPLFEIADLSTVWVYAQIYEFERPWVKEGQEAHITLSYVPGKMYMGRVEYVYPYLNEITRDITVRLRFPNPNGALLPGMFANVVMDCALGTSAVLVPEDAVLDTGVRKVVFIAKGGGRFEGREVRLGVRAGNGSWEVLDGLKAGERVVVSGQFLLDAESKVREAIRKFLEADGEPEVADAPEGHGN